MLLPVQVPGVEELRSQVAFVRAARGHMLVAPDGDARPTFVARQPFGRVAAAPATGDWVAVCDQYCQQLTVYAHDGKRLFGRSLTDGEAVIAAISR
jgi:hypothetical protein